MAKIKFSSYIRRLNRRLVNLGKKFGKESEVYQRQAAKIDARVPASNIRYNKDGFIQIAKPKDLESKGFSQYILETNLNIPTPSEVLAQYKNEYEKYSSEVKKPINQYDFVSALVSVQTTFNKYFDSSQIVEVMEKMIKGKNRLDNLFNKSIYEKGIKSLEAFMSQRETRTRPTYADFVNLGRMFDKYGI